MNSKFLTYAGFLHDEASMTAAVLRDMSGGTLSISFLKSEGSGLICLLHWILTEEMHQPLIPNMEVTYKYYFWSQ